MTEPVIKNQTKSVQPKKSKAKLFIMLVAIISIIVVMKQLGIFQYFSIENVNKITAWINSFGILGPVILVLVWITACVFFLPGTPVALLGGIAFGPFWGAVYSSIGSTLGCVVAFLVARYAARSMVEEWVAGKDQFKKIDEGVKEQGWRMIMITRLVPIFPFNLQNYAYGLTKIDLKTYTLVSWICMLPATIAFSFASGSIVSGQGDVTKTLLYLGVAAVFFVVLSLLPKWIKKKHKV